MHVRLYSKPFFAGAANVGASLSLSFMFGGGGTVGSRLRVFETPPGGVAPFPANVIGPPLVDELFDLEGNYHRPLRSNDLVTFRTSDLFFVGIDHDEEAREDSVVATGSVSEDADIFEVTLVEDPDVMQEAAALGGLDPDGPPQAVRLTGRNQNLLSFPLGGGDGPIQIASDAAGPWQIFLVDFVPPFKRRNVPGPRPPIR
jgi:hypothetical protein